MKNTTPSKHRVWMTAGIILFRAVLLTAVVATSAFAQQPGDLDLTFSGDGKVVETLPPVPTQTGRKDSAHAVAIQPDGKIVVAGTSYSGFLIVSYDFIVARYNPDGSLDTTFGLVGMVLTDVTGDSDYALAVAIQPDGKIVVAGSGSGASVSSALLVRYNSDGTLDTTFDSDGKLMLPIDSAASVAI